MEREGTLFELKKGVMRILSYPKIPITTPDIDYKNQFCVYCSEKIELDASFCVNCGAQIVK